MIPVDRIDVFELGLRELTEFSQVTRARGRFIALYLGLRRMGDEIRTLGAPGSTPASDIERFLDNMYTKTHRVDPFVVLTAPFGGSTSPTAPFSSRSGIVTPGHRYPTNTWRNNFNIQKGVGCPADAETIAQLLQTPTIRLACPHMAVDPENRYMCSLQGTMYRGEEHSIWLRMVGGGYQVVDLDEPLAYLDYLKPSGVGIPIFPLIAVLYGLAPPDVFPMRQRVGIPDFAADFRFSIPQLEDAFDLSVDSEANARVLQAVEGQWFVGPESAVEPTDGEVPTGPIRDANDLPALVAAIAMNTGIGAEVAVARELGRLGWRVGYRGNQRAIGYDLEAIRGDSVLRVEVKSSVGFADLTLLPSEWDAAQRHGEEFVLAVVDFFGTESQSIWYVRDPAGAAVPAERSVTHYVLPRQEVSGLRTDAEFL